MSNKVKWALMLTSVITIIIVTVIRINQISINHEANLIKGEECIKSGGTVVIVEKGFLSLTSTTCEK